jgi:hypothetical protein
VVAEALRDALHVEAHELARHLPESGPVRQRERVRAANADDIVGGGAVVEAALELRDDGDQPVPVRTTCGMKPRSSCHASSARSSSAARSGSERDQTTAWKHESQNHWNG